MSNTKLDDLDLSALSSKELNALTSMLDKGPFSWTAGLFWGLTVSIGAVVYLFKGTPVGSTLIQLALIKGAIFIALSIWARSWSITAAVLLLGWHLLSNARLIMSGSVESKAIYTIFAVVYLFGIMGCYTRRQLLVKARGSESGIT